MAKKNQIQKNLEKAEKVIEDFLKELNKNGFTAKIKKYLSLAWIKNEILLNKALKKLKGYKFKADIKSIKYLSQDVTYRMYTFTVLINERKIRLFVQPLTDDLIPADRGRYGVIPNKLFALLKDAEPVEYKDEDIADEGQNDNAEDDESDNLSNSIQDETEQHTDAEND